MLVPSVTGRVIVVEDVVGTYGILHNSGRATILVNDIELVTTTRGRETVGRDKNSKNLLTVMSLHM